MFDLIQWRARKTPEVPALFFNGRWYTYRDMDGRANRLANRLRSLGVKPGDTVSVIARNHPVHFDLLFAAPKLGFAFAPFNPNLSDAELAAMAALLKPAVVFVDSRHHAAATAMGVPWTRLSDYRDWLAVGSLDLPPAPTLAVDDTHLIFATPRGLAELPYRQVLLNARHSADAWGLSSRDSTVHCLPCFGAEMNLLCLPLLYRGGRVVLTSGFDTDEYLGHLALHRVTVAALSPSMLRQLCAYSDFADADLSSLNWVASVGAPPGQPVRKLLGQRGIRLRLMSALAESGPNLFTSEQNDSEARPELLGFPLPEVQAKVCTADGEETLAGEAGELMLSGPMVFKGYRQSPETSAAVLHDGLLASGMVVRIGKGGQYLRLGLCCDAFASQGMTIHPGEIEAALLRHDNVVECAVAGLTEAGSDQAIVAHIVLQENVEVSDEQLLASITQQLPSSKWPQHFHRMNNLPRDAWGAVDRHALQRVFERRRLAESGPDAAA